MTNEEWHIFSHREHRRTEYTKVRKIVAPPPTPPPKGRGVITEIPMWGGCRLLFVSLSVSTIAETLCDICMPKAFCGLEMCAKKLRELCALCERKIYPLWEKTISSVRERSPHASCKQPNRGNLTYHAPPCGGGVGGGATSSWARNVGGKVLLNLWVLWEIKLPCESRNCSFSHRVTQMNRTHRVSQRH